MMNEKQVLDATVIIEKILTHGINLGDFTAKESEDYLLDLCQYINKNRIFKAVFQNNKVIIETYDWSPIIAIRIFKGTLQVSPLSENNFFESFMTLLAFVTARNTIKEFIDEIDIDEKGIAPLMKKDKDDNEFDWI
tara:strand:- start:1927 stop:2334 length:408 start_codon:yes stop_codon:yes gene_type:complete